MPDNTARMEIEQLDLETFRLHAYANEEICTVIGRGNSQNYKAESFITGNHIGVRILHMGVTVSMASRNFNDQEKFFVDYKPNLAELRLQWRELADASTLHMLPQEALIASIQDLARELLKRTVIQELTMTRSKATCTCGFEVDLLENDYPTDKISDHVVKFHDNNVLVYDYRLTRN